MSKLIMWASAEVRLAEWTSTHGSNPRSAHGSTFSMSWGWSLRGNNGCSNGHKDLVRTMIDSKRDLEGQLLPSRALRRRVSDRGHLLQHLVGRARMDTAVRQAFGEVILNPAIAAVRIVSSYL